MIGYVFKIEHNDAKLNLCWVGCSILTPYQTWAQLKHHYKKWKAMDAKASFFSIFTYFSQCGFDNFVMVEIKKYEVADKKELIAYRQLWHKKLNTIDTKEPLHLLAKCILNIPDNSKPNSKLSKYNKQYYVKNKDILAEKQKTYYRNNIDKMKEYHKQYREKNRAYLEQKAAKIVVCECGANITQGNLAQHRKSKKHLAYIGQTETQN